MQYWCESRCNDSDYGTDANHIFEYNWVFIIFGRIAASNTTDLIES